MNGTQRTAATYMNIDDSERAGAEALARLGAGGKFPGNMAEDSR